MVSSNPGQDRVLWEPIVFKHECRHVSIILCQRKDKILIRMFHEKTAEYTSGLTCNRSRDVSVVDQLAS